MGVAVIFVQRGNLPAKQPAIVVDADGERKNYRRVELLDNQGNAVATVVQGENCPAPGCGVVQVWIEAARVRALEE